MPSPSSDLPESDTDRRHSLEEFVAATDQQDRGEGFFELERDRLLEVNLGDGGEEVWMKAGAMVAYTGRIGFEREGMLEHGFGKFLKKAFSGEGAKMTRATGRGRLYLADQGKKVTVLYLKGESLFVNGNDMLAFEPTLEWDINLMRSLGAIAGGGLFNVRFAGRGMLAITTHYDPLTLRVEPGGPPVFTDPQATIAWSGNLEPQFKTDVQLKTLLGRGSGESIQMQFAAGRSPGFVVVQPYEERAMPAGAR
ncbi:AIM24 family protein [Alienimonas chondri]|uniref:AIM24 family protein n=1 Tax=Alienimonas chondri TaxID=2681879 RepID=UPI0014890BBB